MKVEFTIEKCHKIEGINQYCEPIKTPDIPTVVFTILNRGQTPVMLDKFELWIKNTEKIGVPQVTRGCYMPDAFQPDKGYLPLPYDLHFDRRYRYRIYEEDIAKVLREKGYSTSTELIGKFVDQNGNAYKSPSYWFDLNRSREDCVQSKE